MASQHTKRSLWRLSWGSSSGGHTFSKGNSQFSLINAAFLMSRTSDCTPLGSSRRIQSLPVCSIGSFARMEHLTPQLMPYPTIQLFQLIYRPSQLLLRRGCLMSLQATRTILTVSNYAGTFSRSSGATSVYTGQRHSLLQGSCLAQAQHDCAMSRHLHTA